MPKPRRKSRNAHLTFIQAKGFDLIGVAEGTGEKLGTVRTISSGHRRMTDRYRNVLAKLLKCDPAEIPDPPTPGRNGQVDQ